MTKLSISSLFVTAAISLAAISSANAAPPTKAGSSAKGDILTDEKGMALYTFDKDADGKSACNGPCAQNWPPFKAADAAAPAGWTTITREDGTKQWAFKGKPLYTFAKDTGPADTKGDGFLNGAWHIVQP